MKKPIRVLIVEDREDDAELVLLELQRGGYDPVWLRVETPEAMSAALDEPWNIIISDWSMPRFSAMAAFATLRETGLDIPFIIVSGTIGEETAVAAMKAGVQDFMTKGHLSRLIPAIERELREVEVRREAHQMHEHLLISERMASVGTLAAGVAHEINNPLAAVIGNVEMATETLARMVEEVNRQSASTPEQIDSRQDFLTRSAERLAEIQEAMVMIDEAAERMRLVVRDLRVFSHPGDEKYQGPVDIRTVVESSLRMASTEIRHRAQIVREYDEVALVDGSESRLGQIFLNLIVNAAQSIPEGRAAANEIVIAIRMAETGQVIVEIRDTGSGIPPDILPRIFDPFFTTKPSGIGTGLGLAICHRLVVALGGEISVESEVGIGTRFRIALPVARLDVQKELTTLLRTPMGRRGSVLLVDDEPALRKTIPAMLKKDLDVRAVGTAREAIQLITEGARFDLILCDLMMPEMTGMDLYEELDRSVPDQARKMAFVTGGAFTDGSRTFLDRIPNPVIEKPFTSAMIRQFVRDLLG
jgi:signal transduction histidine kinase